MSPFTAVLFYIGAHFGLFFVVLRYLNAFKREKIIFLYHMVSFCSLGLWTWGRVDLGTAAGILSLHGIYSLSFLELWALSSGGYSLRILEVIHKSAGGSVLKELETMQLLGAAKKKERLGAVIDLKMVRRRGDKFELTFFGRLFSQTLRLLVWPSGS